MRTGTFKPLAALVLTGVGSAFVLGFKTVDDGTITLAPKTATGDASSSGSTGTAGSSGTSGSTSSSGSSDASGSSGTSGSTGGNATAAAYADGTWTGSAVSEPWGAFQVQVVVNDGAITKVAVVESPSDRHSSRINSQAVPILTKETLQSQNASVDMVSGATWTSESYATSLQSALDDAAAAA
jgi:uncharacterized protein with FMN-binding domain